jgi:hypothetical protein
MGEDYRTSVQIASPLFVQYMSIYRATYQKAPLLVETSAGCEADTKSTVNL